MTRTENSTATTGDRRGEYAERAIGVLVGIAIAFVIYAPFSMWVFETTLGAIIGRAYFMFMGAAIALYAFRPKEGQQ